MRSITQMSLCQVRAAEMVCGSPSKSTVSHFEVRSEDSRTSSASDGTPTDAKSVDPRKYLKPARRALAETVAQMLAVVS
jgi:hypothetical protein